VSETATDILMDLRSCNAVYDGFMFSEARHFGLLGGAGSGKSYACADKLIMRAITERGHRLCAFRKVARTVKRSVFALLVERIAHWGLTDMTALNRTDYTIKFQNKSEIWCMGLDEQEKLKSIMGMSSAWVEEATEFTSDDLNQINLRIRGETPGYKQIMYSFNGISARHHLKGRLFDNPASASTETLVTTFNDNDYIDDEYKAELEEMGRKSANFKAVYVDGGWGVLEGVIYAGFVFDDYPESFNDTFYGLDFGFNHPSALIRVDMHDGEAYITEEIYESGWTTADLIAEMDRLEISKDAIIYCDAAEPDRIEEIRRASYSVQSAYKGQGSVRAGIDFCQSLTLHSTQNNVNLNGEIQSYAWRTTRDGSPMDEPIKIHDDAMDAMRYALYSHLGHPAAKPFTFERSQIGF
jgi:phage terminase large subunit